MPNVFYDDIKQLTEEQWKEKRRSGIGGSDAGAIVGVNKYHTIYDVYYEKLGFSIEQQDSEKKRITFAIGHRLESLVAEVFQAHFPSIMVQEDTIMYQHSTYPFMLANIDYRLHMPNQMDGILECKTLTNAEEWESTDFCRGIAGRCPVSYELQVRHYMAVLDLDIACVAGLDLLRKNIYFVWMHRDKNAEQQLMTVEYTFWNAVKLQKLPTMWKEFTRLQTSLRASVFKKFFRTEKNTVFTVTEDDDIAVLNRINYLMQLQQTHTAKLKECKEEKEELAAQLFSECERKNGIRPEKVELYNINADFSVSQSISFKQRDIVVFDKDAFRVAYQTAFQEELPVDIDENTAMILCRQCMPEQLSDFVTCSQTSGKFHFGKRKIETIEKEKDMILA